AGDWDSRIYAISPANADWLASIGIWQNLDADRICPISRMQVFGDAADSQIQFDAIEANIDNLGFIVESGQLEAALWSALARTDVELLTGTAPTSALFSKQQAEIHLEDQRLLTAELL